MVPIYVDCTTTFEERGRHPHGTTRVERGLLAAFARLADPAVSFFRRAGADYVPVTPEQAVAAAGAPTRGDLGRQPQPDWWRHPAMLRARALRRRLRAMRRAVSPRPAPQSAAHMPADIFPPGAVLFFSGEHDRHDVARLAALKRERRLRLAFLFYDLLAVLPDDDPRLADPACAGLPPSDFIVRAADLALPISRFSAAALTEHVARRGCAGPAVRPIRLFAEPPQAGRGPVQGLVPGRFVLAVGDVVHRKNHDLLATVWRRLGPGAPVLAVAGRVDREGDAFAARVRSDPTLHRAVRLLPDLDDEALGWLYRNCRFTVFPSRLEGFGLPVAESLAAGKVCLASNAAAIPEAGQGAAILLDPDDPGAWAAGIRSLAEDAVLAAEEARVARTFRRITAVETAAEILALLRS